MIAYICLLLPLLFLPADASSIRSRNSKNELVPFESSEVESPRKGDKWGIANHEPFFVKLRTSTQADAGETKRDKKRKRQMKKRTLKGKHLKKRRTRRDLLTGKSKPIRQEKSIPGNPQAEIDSDLLLKNLTKTANRVEILKALSSLSKKTENGQLKDERGEGTQRRKEATGLKRNHSKHRHSLPDQPLYVKMTYPVTPKPDRHLHKYTYKDLIADRKRLEQKINYIRNMLSVNDSTIDDPVRIRRRSDSDKTANKIAKMFLTLSAVNDLHEKRKSKCKYGVEEDEEEEDRVQDVWEKERKSSPTRKSSSSNEERYKVKKWIEFMKNKRSSGKTCPCMANVRGDDSDVFPLEQKLPKDYFLMERSRSSEESSELYGDSYYQRDKLMGQYKKRNKEDQEKGKGKNGKKKLELPLNDLELYRSRAKQILQNAEEILDKIKYEEERRLAAPNILMNHLKELTSRIQSDPRNNENDLIRKIQKNLGWNPLPKSKESPDVNGFVDNVKSYILDPYEKAKALTDESAKMLSSYLLRNLAKMEESSEEGQMDQEDRENPQVFFGKIETKEEEKPIAASLAKEADPLSKNKEELQNWEDTISTIMNGAEEAVFKNRMEDIIKEQQKKLTDYENSHHNSEETDDSNASEQQEEVKSPNTEHEGSENEQTAKQQEFISENPSERLEDEQTANQQEKVEAAKPDNPSKRLEDKEDEQIAEFKSENLSERSEDNEDEQTADQQEEVKSANPDNLNERSEDKEDEEVAKQQEEVKSADPESEKLSIQLGEVEKSDEEADEIGNPLTGDQTNAEETSERVENAKNSGKKSEDNQEEQELGKEILDEIIKTFDENADSVGSEREIKNPQENPKTADGEEENEDQIAESPNTDSEETSGLVYLTFSKSADDYDVLDEETGGNPKENPNEQTDATLQRQNPLEMREESDSGEKTTEDNPESLEQPQDDKEIVNMENNHDSNIKETQTGEEEVSQESENPEMFLEKAQPIEEDNLKRQDEQEDQTNDEAKTKNADEPEKAESESSLDKEDDELLESTAKSAESLEDVENEERVTDDDTPLQATNTDEESLEDETPLRKALENEKTAVGITDDLPSGKNDETNLEKRKEETMNEDDFDNAEVQEALNETPREEEEEEEEELQEDNSEATLREAKPTDAENSSEIIEKAQDEENLDEVDEKSLKSINPDANSEEDAETLEPLNRQNEENQDETLQKAADSKENLKGEDQNPDEKTNEETEEDIQETVQQRATEQTDESSDENHNEETLNAAFEDLKRENLTDEEKSENQEASEEVEEGSKEDEENQESSESQKHDETVRKSLKNNPDEKEAFLEKTNSMENSDKTEETLEDDDEADAKESLETDPEDEKVEKTEQTENPEENVRSTNLQSVEETIDPDAEEETRADITDDSRNELYLVIGETPLKSAKLDKGSEESLEENGKETSREENLGENLILEENDESSLREADSIPYLLQKPAKLKVPKSIGQIMADLDGKDDVTSFQNLNPDRIDHMIVKIDEAEQQNLLEGQEVDCRKECACAEEIDTRSRNIGRYEIAKDFLHWMKDLQLNRVLSDD